MTALYIIGSLLWGGAILVIVFGTGDRSRIAASAMILFGIIVWSLGVDVEASERGKRIGIAEGYRDGVYACYDGVAVLDTLSNGNIVITEVQNHND